jgi:uncharacterized membrane protein YeaQ/YmgE (transglycosylase-associated protein family)
MFVFGLPAHWLLKRGGFTHVFFYLVAGVVGGLLLGSLLRASGSPLYASVSFMDLVGVLCGGSVAVVFWLIRRPDHDAPTRPQK